MKLQLRQKNKRKQALDAFASVAKTWSEWHLGKKVSTTAAKGAKKAAKVKGGAKGTRLRIAGAVALVGGAGAAVAKKLKGGTAEPLYTPPGPAPDMASPPPSPVVVEDLTPAEAKPEPESVPDAPESTPGETSVAPETSVVAEDLASEAPAEPEAASEPAAEPAPDDAGEPATPDAPDAAAEPDPGAGETAADTDEIRRR